MADPVEPTLTQIEFTEGCGWIYVEEEFKFMKGDFIGYFTESGWQKVR